MIRETALQRPSLLQPLRRRDFRLVFSGETVSLIGDQFHFIALAWLVLQLTGSGLAPISLAAAGVVVDIGAVTLLFWLAGALIAGAALVGLVTGAASRIQDVEPDR